MYYRIAIRAPSSPNWRWVSTPLGSINCVKQWLLYYHAVPRDRLRVFTSPSREDLRQQLLCESGGVVSASTQAAEFLSGDGDRLRAARSEATTTSQGVAERQLVRVPDSSSASPLDRRRDELERGAGGDHDLPYRFSLPASTLQRFTWVRLLARVEHGDLQSERIALGAGTRSGAECADEVSSCTRSNTAA
jgi:hypothetical protein